MNVIENCSPYYIRFSHDGIDKIIEFCLGKIPNEFFTSGFKHYKFSESDGKKLLSFTPFNELISIQTKRISLFITEPGKYYGAHKDGYPLTMFSINYPILVSDNKCVTSWYSDEEILNHNYIVNRDISINAGIQNFQMGMSREVQDFNKSKHVPAKTMIAQVGEGILFNTDIFHDWDNSKSTNRRVVLTLRHTNPSLFSFEKIKKTLFNI